MKKLSRSSIILGAITIYGLWVYIAYLSFHYFSYVPIKLRVSLTIVSILLGELFLWILFTLYRRYSPENHSSQSERHNPVATPKEPKPQKEEHIQVEKKEILVTESPKQEKKSKKIQESYKRVLLECQKKLSPKEYKKFQEDTKYDILLYDALIVSQDKTWDVLKKIQTEKGEFYANTVLEILK